MPWVAAPYSRVYRVVISQVPTTGVLYLYYGHNALPYYTRVCNNVVRDVRYTRKNTKVRLERTRTTISLSIRGEFLTILPRRRVDIAIR